MKANFLLGLEEVVFNIKAYLGPVQQLSDQAVVCPVLIDTLEPSVAERLRVGAFLLMVRTVRPANPPFSMAQVMPQAVIGRVHAYTSSEEGPGVLNLELTLLGLFSANHEATGVQFSRDMGSLTTAQNLHVFYPSDRMLEFMVNGTLGDGFRIHFGSLRQAESEMHNAPINKGMFVHMPDIRGKRTAMFGKTRLGKSNAVKLLMQGMLEMTAKSQDVGQLVFDVNGEYANDNPQDGNRSIASMYGDRTDVYFLAHRSSDGLMNTARKYIRYNFYEKTGECCRLMTELLDEGVMNSEDLRYFLQLEFPDFLPFVKSQTPRNCNMRFLRRIQLLWTILYIAGFSYSEDNLVQLAGEHGWVKNDLTNPRFSQSLRMAMYQAITNKPVPRTPTNFQEMAREIEVYARFALTYKNDPNLVEAGLPMVEKEDEIAMRFIVPDFGVGPRVLASCAPYHSHDASDFMTDIIRSIDDGRTVIVDLGSANQTVLQFFSRTLSQAVFRHQEAKFVTNQLQSRYVQLYFEEAHMIFPANQPGQVTDIYSRFAKEGAKFHIGIVYSTQSPSTVNGELLSQTENFFIGHISNKKEFDLLGEVQHTFRSIGETVLKYRQPGYMHVLTHSHRYVVPVQAKVFSGPVGGLM
jgi:hypothetical protein